jgi:transposase-like protein
MSILDAVPSEAKCQALVRRCLFGKRPFCPRCLSSHIRAMEGRYWCPTCRRKFSLTSASIFRHRRIPLRQILLLLVCWQKKVPFWTTCQIVGVSAPTVRRYFRRFRESLVYESPSNLQGNVEIDEAWLGKRRHGNQTVLVGVTERATDKTVIKIAPRRDQEWTDRLLLGHVRPERSFVFHDGWDGYHGIDCFFGYKHSFHIHNHGDFGPTNHIENIWSRLKRFITRTWDHSWKEHLPHILREFEARINAPELFDSPLNYLQTCLTLVPIAC